MHTIQLTPWPKIHFTLYCVVSSSRIHTNFVIKVADFGLAESIDTTKKLYFRQDKKAAIKLPVKWMAPESINDGIFSEKSDVVCVGMQACSNLVWPWTSELKLESGYMAVITTQYGRIKVKRLATGPCMVSAKKCNELESSVSKRFERSDQA